MSAEKTISSKVGSYISTLLRIHFRKGPTFVFVTVNRPYIVIHFRGFIAPVETVLMKKRGMETCLGNQGFTD